MSSKIPYLVGLTGPLASGKSTVSRQLEAAGFEVVDADRLVAELYRPGGAGARAVGAMFGPKFIEEDGSVDHERLATRVFSDPKARRRLEALVHPLVRDRFRELARASTAPVVVLEATLLVEAGYAPDFDLIVSVEAPRSACLERAVARGLGRKEALARLAAQGNGTARREGAALVIDNVGTLDDLRIASDELIAVILERAGSRRGDG